MRPFPIFAAALCLAGALPAHASQRLDAHFVQNRVFVDAPLKGGGHLRFFTDTGGGGVALWKQTIAKLSLPTTKVTGQIAEELGPDMRQVAGRLPLAPGLFPDLPPPILVLPDMMTPLGMPSEADADLGSTWFAGHIWTWDYPHGTLALEDADWTPPVEAKIIPVTFRPRKGPLPPLHFPRIVITIAGEKVPMLLDTGATTVLTPAAAAKLGGARARATSMIIESRFDAWRKAHPAWPVIANAQVKSGSPMIRVPDVRIAGIEVGPVWFTMRPDVNFRRMSEGMDGPVEGSIGGNAFRSLRMTVDYVHGRAAFRRE